MIVDILNQFLFSSWAAGADKRGGRGLGWVGVVIVTCESM